VTGPGARKVELRIDLARPAKLAAALPSRFDKRSMQAMCLHALDGALLDSTVIERGVEAAEGLVAIARVAALDALCKLLLCALAQHLRGRRHRAFRRLRAASGQSSREQDAQ
jgi:hypothetical protein